MEYASIADAKNKPNLIFVNEKLAKSFKFTPQDIFYICSGLDPQIDDESI